MNIVFLKYLILNFYFVLEDFNGKYFHCEGIFNVRNQSLDSSSWKKCSILVQEHDNYWCLLQKILKKNSQHNWQEFEPNIFPLSTLFHLYMCVLCWLLFLLQSVVVLYRLLVVSSYTRDISLVPCAFFKPTKFIYFIYYT